MMARGIVKIQFSNKNMNLKRMRKVAFAFASILLMASKCYNSHELLSVCNQTDRAVYILPSFDYPDTAFNFTNKTMYRWASVSSQQTKTVFPFPFCEENGTWEDMIYSDTLLFFVFDKEMTDSCLLVDSIDEIKVFKTYKFTREQLISCGCKIVLQ